MNEELIAGKTCVHIESGKEVRIIDAKCQMKVGETWQPAVAYEHNDKIWVRTKEQFLEKFHD